MSRRDHLVYLLVNCVLIVACGGSMPSAPFPYASLRTPECEEHRPPGNGQPSRLQHACWRWGERDDRDMTASCRIDRNGTLECWRDSLRDVPPGEYSSLDDDGLDACAVRSDGRVVCWGRGGGPGIGVHDWSHIPRTKFRSVVVGLPVKGGRRLACGLSEEQTVDCWEEEPAVTFRLPGHFISFDVGGGDICGISREGLLECAPTPVTQLGQSKLGTIASYRAITLGSPNEGGCVVDHRKRGHCWGKHIARFEHPLDVGPVKQIRAGHEHACALRENGRVECFGGARPPPNLRFRYISAPSMFANYCGITLDGIGYCWGDPSSSPIP